MENCLGSIPILQIRGSSALVYYESVFARRFANNILNRRRMMRAQRKQYSGKMTEGARKRISKAITLMCQACKPKWVFNPIINQYVFHRLSFITLTVSDSRNIDAKTAYKKLLKNFLQWLRRTKGVKLYVWKAELQQRGQIHYHITCPNFIDYREIREVWNRLQHEAGLLDEYALEHGHFNPNSTDIHETRKAKDLPRYLLKELIKEIDSRRLKVRKEIKQAIKAGELPEMDKRQIEMMVDDMSEVETAINGKVWDCSDNLSGLKYFSTPLTYKHERQLQQVIDSGARVVAGDWWKLVYFDDTGPPDAMLNDEERTRFKDHLLGIIGELPEPKQIIEMELPEDPIKMQTETRANLVWRQLDFTMF